MILFSCHIINPSVGSELQSLFVCVCLCVTNNNGFFDFSFESMLVEGLPAYLFPVFCFMCLTFSLWRKIEKGSKVKLSLRIATVA